MRIRVTLCQKPLGVPLTRNEISIMREFSPHFVCFPEYFFTNIKIGNFNQTPHNQRFQLKRIKTLSEKLNTCVIGGTMPEISEDRIHNTSFIFDRGQYLGYYRKKNLFFAEKGKITPGENYRTFTSMGVKFGVLICADVFHDEAFDFMKSEGVRIIFSPTFSIFKDETPEDKFKRDREIYVSGAMKSDSVIVKVCGVRSDFKPFLQARSLIASPEGIITRVTPEEEHTSKLMMREIEI